MERFIAVDSGKYATKVAAYNPKTKETKKFTFRTKMSEGFFEDDAIESATFISEIAGKTYKIGNGARMQADMETTKMGDIHKICTLSAIAMICDPDAVDTVHVAIGIPVKEFENVVKRNEYREFILPDGEVSVSLKCKSSEPVKVVKFKIASKIVCPESGGILYLDPAKYKASSTGVVDIGNLNINGTVWNGFDLAPEYSVTDELGGQVLIQGLSQQLSVEFSRCDANRVAQTLRMPHNERRLIPIKPNKDIEDKSRESITAYCREHVKKIKLDLDTKHWSLDFMNLVFVGGTSALLSEEIKEVFGEEAVIADEPEYANVLGFLTKLCARVLNIMIPLKAEESNDLGDSIDLADDTAKKEVA